MNKMKKFRFFKSLKQKDFSTESSVELAKKELAEAEVFMGDDEDDYEARQIRRAYIDYRQQVFAKRNSKRLRVKTEDDTVLFMQHTIKQDMERVVRTASRSTQVRRYSELAPTNYFQSETTAIADPILEIELSQVLSVPGYPSPWKAPIYDYENFMKW
ncbi:hypothetical protein EW145_g5070 [Phellinidium pouzarii]|uniref:Uncharacterized protein n=1 Tax=Phellinidium pouzarii TaxID=167371 RepID=A0A4S4L1C5_9AGAM|nr:hypothetical protein EW145_g5070 [Phellinidium pouzarii]